jgi:hypothetical protein
MVKYFANLYPGLSFQLTIGRIDFCSLCSFMVPYYVWGFWVHVTVFPCVTFVYYIITVVDATPYVSLLFICVTVW